MDSVEGDIYPIRGWHNLPGYFRRPLGIQASMSLAQFRIMKSSSMPCILGLMFGQDSSPPWASVFTFVKWESNNPSTAYLRVLGKSVQRDMKEFSWPPWWLREISSERHERIFLASLVAQTIKSLLAVRETRVWFLVWEDPLEKDMAPTPVFLPGKSHGWRSLAGYSPWGLKELDTTEWLHFSFPERTF